MLPVSCNGLAGEFAAQFVNAFREPFCRDALAPAVEHVEKFALLLVGELDGRVALASSRALRISAPPSVDSISWRSRSRESRGSVIVPSLTSISV